RGDQLRAGLQVLHEALEQRPATTHRRARARTLRDHEVTTRTRTRQPTPLRPTSGDDARRRPLNLRRARSKGRVHVRPRAPWRQPSDTTTRTGTAPATPRASLASRFRSPRASSASPTHTTH